MEEYARADLVLFGGFRFDRRGGVLSRQNEEGRFVPVVIGSRAFDILGLLIDRQGGLVSKDEILTAVWPGVVVDDANVTVQISALRRVLDEGRCEPSLIQTVPWRGYRFTAAVRLGDGIGTDREAPSAAGSANSGASQSSASGTHVRRDKAALFPVGARPTRRFAPAGSNRGRHGGDEMSEAPG